MKKRDELECVSGVKGRKITMNLGMYVRGVWLRRVDQYDIDR